MKNLPSILQGYDPALTPREFNRLHRCRNSYAEILDNLVKHNTERETQMFLYDELQRREPRETVINRLCGRILRIQARYKREELEAYVAAVRK